MRTILAAILLCSCVTPAGQLRFKSGQSLGTTTPCSADGGACPGTQRCVVLDLVGGDVGPVCVDLDICSRLTCSGHSVFTCSNPNWATSAQPVVEIYCSPAE